MDICGYGENNIGPFKIEGTLSVFSNDKLKEKEGVKTFKKFKLGRFSLKKYYTNKILEEMAEEQIADRLKAPLKLIETHQRLEPVRIHS